MGINLQHPLPGGTPTDPFGWRPAIPGVRPAELHNGTDIAAPEGTPIFAAHAGRVSYVGWDNAGGGWMVKIGAAFGSTLYLHMRERSPLVNVGDTVQAGQAIGYVGSTGAATGPHLHWMLRINGMEVDPLPYLTATPTGQKEDEHMRGIIYRAEKYGCPHGIYAGPTGGFVVLANAEERDNLMKIGTAEAWLTAQTLDELIKDARGIKAGK